MGILAWTATILVLQTLSLVSLWIMFYFFLKQQGRLLLRLDDLEANLGLRGRAQDVAPPGLKVGTPITLPPSLRFVDGKLARQDDFKGKRLLLIYWSPTCGYCSQIAPDLALLQRSLGENHVGLLFLSRGDVTANRELADKYGLTSPILLIEESMGISECFKGLGTPSAYLLDEQGKVARTLAVGAKQVPALARELAGNPEPRRLPGERSLRESHIERHGLKVGTPAPDFNLPDLFGQMVSLSSYRDTQVLLVFSDPHCGPCNELAPHLVRLHREHEHNGIAVVMIGRGDVEENLRKARDHGFQFPVVLQRKWELSRQYGIFATPAAFLIGKDGVIAKDVARGTDAILALASGV